MRRTTLPATLLLAAVLALAAPASAVYIQTELSLQAPGEADAGDDVDLVIGPSPDEPGSKDKWAGRGVKVGYGFDRAEQANSDPDAAVSDADRVHHIIGEVLLDDAASGSFRWTIPAEVDGKNVDLFVEDEEGNRLAFAYLAVGDAPPVMRIMQGMDGEPEPALEGTEEDAAADGEDDIAGEASAIGLVSLLAALGALGAAVQVARRSR